MLELTLRQFEELNLFSNKNLEKVIGNVVNESSNAVFVSMFEDSVVLLDHEQGQFYSADYSFDKEKLVLALEHFEPIKLKKEELDFKVDVRNFFESEEFDVESLAESYKDKISAQDKYVTELINEAMSLKDFSEKIDYQELSKLNESNSLKNKQYFKAYGNRLDTNPMTSVTYFNWKNPVKVSLVESESVKVVNSSIKEKASDLWKRDAFKKAFIEASKTSLEDIDEGRKMFAECFSQYPQVFFLDKADKKALFGKTILASPQLREHLDVLSKGIEMLMEEDEISSIGKQYISEAALDEETKNTSAGLAPELSVDEITELAKELKTISEKVEDSLVKERLMTLSEELVGSIEEGTRVDLVKEAVQLLSI